MEKEATSQPQLSYPRAISRSGSTPSAIDISRDIAGIAKEVHFASRSLPDITNEKLPTFDNMWLHSMSIVRADIILHCTGYKYHLPFLEINGIVTMDDNRVGPLYKHIFPPSLAPTLSFVGLPWKMMEDVKAFYSSLEASGTPKHYTHDISPYKFEYEDWLAAQCGCPVFEEWRKQMFVAAIQNLIKRQETYRNEWDDHHLVLQAHEDFRKYTLKGIGVMDKRYRMLS
ncbi:hypothetical protein C1H46_001633 [Malus baccata]|uniref:Flavin-containing monooxygenase n=1 Tax=Malus baccata TaxID=106549 RepID=A0A540NQE8_MALBA|nr:hypothetical protein C1H46_001633 [Malus baccata]